MVQHGVAAIVLDGKKPSLKLNQKTLIDSMEAECTEKAKRTDHARAARRRPHDVLPPFKCSPVAHCPMQATLAQCPEFVMAMERFYAYNRP